MKHLDKNDSDKIIYNKLNVLLDSGSSSNIIYKDRPPQSMAAKLKGKHTTTILFNLSLGYVGNNHGDS